jgi:hypothetical protein
MTDFLCQAAPHLTLSVIIQLTLATNNVANARIGEPDVARTINDPSERPL